MKNLLDFTLDELKEQLSPPFRAKQIFEWLYKKNATSFDEMLNLPKDLRANLAQEFYLDPLKCVKFELEKILYRAVGALLKFDAL